MSSFSEILKVHGKISAGLRAETNAHSTSQCPSLVTSTGSMSFFLSSSAESEPPLRFFLRCPSPRIQRVRPPPSSPRPRVHCDPAENSVRAVHAGGVPTMTSSSIDGGTVFDAVLNFRGHTTVVYPLRARKSPETLPGSDSSLECSFFTIVLETLSAVLPLGSL